MRLRGKTDRTKAPWIEALALVASLVTAAILFFVLPELPEPMKTFFVGEPWKAFVAPLIGGAGVGGLVRAMLVHNVSKREVRERAVARYAGEGVRPFIDLTDATLRIHRALQDAREFLPRDLTDQVCEVLRGEEPVLITGPSMAGKSRLAAEAVRQTHPSRPTLVAESGEALISLLDQTRPEGCLIWLGDLERFLNDGFTRERVQQLRADRNLLVATIRTSERAKFEVTSDAKPPGWDVFDAFKEFRLNAQLSETEVERLVESSYAGLQKRIGTYGLAAYLGGAPIAWNHYCHGETNHPLGWASIKAAADWYRATQQPIPDSLLENLAPVYLHQSRRYDSYNRDEEIAWGSEPLNDSVRLLLPGPEKSWTVFDYILDRLTSAATPIRAEIWEAVVSTRFSPGVNLYAGGMAYEEGQREIARDLWTLVYTTGGEAMFRAANNLGLLLVEDGDDQEAESLFREALASPESAALATVNLARLLAGNGRRGEAETLLRQALSSTDTSGVALAALSLGSLLAEENPKEAKKFFKQALNSGGVNVDAAAGASLGLAKLLEQNGDPHEAENILRQASNSPNLRAAPLAKVRLGLLLRKVSRPGAEELFRQVLENDDGPDDRTVLEAAGYLGILMLQNGNYKEAEALLRRALRSKDPDTATRAAGTLGQFFAVMGHRPEAKELFKQILASSDPTVAAFGALNLGNLLAEDGNRLEAENYLRQVLNSSNTKVVDAAAGSLGMLLATDDEHEEAERLLRQAGDSSDRQIAEKAIADLGQLLARDGKWLEAERLLRQTVKNGLNRTGMVELSLGCLLANQRRPEAEAFFLRALDSIDPQTAVMAAANLELLLTEKKKRRKAKRLLRRRMNSTNPQAAAAATLSLANLLAEGGHRAEAITLLERAMKSANPYAAAEAERKLAKLRDAE
jgi:tetratricopeptide (TPR) repeat protein